VCSVAKQRILGLCWLLFTFYPKNGVMTSLCDPARLCHVEEHLLVASPVT
jgi:hypothetical protein